MLECDVVQDLFKPYHDGMCSDRTAELINEHLEECEQCRNEYKILCACEAEMAEKERDIYEKGMEMIATAQKEKTLSRIIFMDMLFNIGIFIFNIRMLHDQIMAPGFSGEEMGFIFSLFIFVACGVFIGYEFTYFMLRKRERTPYVTENMAKISIAVKVGMLFFFLVIACVFGLRNIYDVFVAGVWI